METGVALCEPVIRILAELTLASRWSDATQAVAAVKMDVAIGRGHVVYTTKGTVACLERRLLYMHKGPCR